MRAGFVFVCKMFTRSPRQRQASRQGLTSRPLLQQPQALCICIYYAIFPCVEIVMAWGLLQAMETAGGRHECTHGRAVLLTQAMGRSFQLLASRMLRSRVVDSVACLAFACFHGRVNATGTGSASLKSEHSAAYELHLCSCWVESRDLS